MKPTEIINGRRILIVDKEKAFRKKRIKGFM
jgi:hypothetical protein